MRLPGTRACLRDVMVVLLVGCASHASPPAPPATPSPAPQAVPVGCGVVDVDDHTRPPSDARARIVRDAIRQKLSGLDACARPYRIHADVTLEPMGGDGLRVRIRLAVYANTGTLAGEIPTKVALSHVAPDDVESVQVLLRSGAEQAAEVFTQNFH